MNSLQVWKLKLQNNSGDHVSYKQDPRPHLRVEHSTPSPLWDNKGPREIKKDVAHDYNDLVSCYPHCQLGLLLDTLHWHEKPICEPEIMENPGPSGMGVPEEVLTSNCQVYTNDIVMEDEEKKSHMTESIDKEKKPEPSGSKTQPWSWSYLPDLCLRHVFMWLSDRERYQASLVCHHWYRVMRSPWLWRSRRFHFNGRLYRPHCSEKEAALNYVRSLGCYLEEVEVHVSRPHSTLAARRIQVTIKLLLQELVRVRACLHSFTLSQVEMDQNSRGRNIQTSMLRSLIFFLRWNAYHLRHLCLQGCCLTFSQGMEILEVVSTIQERQHFTGHEGILSLDLQDFFSSSIDVYRRQSLPRIMQRFWNLECLKLSYRCISDEMLEALVLACGAAAWTKSIDRNWGCNWRIFRSLFLHCHLLEPHSQVVRGSAWTKLVQNCPELAVYIHIERIVNTDRLARILLPEIPVRTFSINSCYISHEEWSAKPIFSFFLPSYRNRLQMLTLDLNNYHETLDDELCQLVVMCDRLVYLKAWAFLDTTFVDHVLFNCLEKKCALQTINVRLYTSAALARVKEENLEQVLFCYRDLTDTEVNCSAVVCPHFLIQ